MSETIGPVTAEDLDKAAAFCKLVQTADLFEYLGVEKRASSEDALAALAKQRKRMQSMQSNPKFKDTARSLIKSFRSLQRVANDPSGHLERQAQEHEAERLPMLELAIACVLADGRVSVQEEAFLRSSAVGIGISEATYERVLREKADAAGAILADAAGAPPPPITMPGQSSPSSTSTALPLDEPTEERRLRGAEGHAWWDENFTRLLLLAIPGGPGDMVDIYCRTALSALTLLPERPLLSYVGVDRDPVRLVSAQRSLPHGSNTRVQLTAGLPHEIPLPDASVDYLLGVRALANVPDTRPVFAEAMRVLRPGGRIILAEPDGLAETFYFDQNLTAYNAAFHRLVHRVDATMVQGIHPDGQPGLSLGPKLTARMRLAGFQHQSTHIHVAHNMALRPFRKMARRMQRYPAVLARAAGLEQSPQLEAVNQAVRALASSYSDDQVGLSGHNLPLFLCVGTKPA